MPQRISNGASGKLQVREEPGLCGCGRSAVRTWLPADSLIIREITGKNRHPSTLRAEKCAHEPVKSVLFAKYGLKNIRDFFSVISGNFAPGTGKTCMQSAKLFAKWLNLGATRETPMSLGLIAFGTILCLLCMIALMPPFDGKWE